MQNSKKYFLFDDAVYYGEPSDVEDYLEVIRGYLVNLQEVKVIPVTPIAAQQCRDLHKQIEVKVQEVKNLRKAITLASIPEFLP